MPWKELWGRKFGVQRFEGVATCTALPFYRNVLKAHCDNYLIAPCGKNQVIHADENEFGRFINGMYEALGKNYTFFRKVYEDKLLPDYKKYVKFGMDLDPTKLSMLTNKEL